MATDRAKNIREAAFLLRKANEKVTQLGADTRGLAERRIQAKRDEIDKLLGQIDSQINNNPEAKGRMLVQKVNTLFDDLFSTDDVRDERKKALMQLNDFRRRDKSTVIRISVDTRESLRTIGKEKGLKNDNDVVEYLLAQCAI